MAKLNFENKWVLITGASSGLGREIARYMAAKENAHLVITARRKERLEELKKEIESSGSSRVEILPADLADKADVDRLFEDAIRKADIYAVINNAGVTFYDRCEEAELERFESIVNVNLMALMRLSLKFLAYFQKQGSGAIFNVTSETAFVPIPYQNVYSASKHAAQAFTEGLYMEYRGSDIVISSFAPGGIATEMITLAGLDKKIEVDSPFNMKADVVARKAVKSFKKKKFVSIPGIMNKMTVFLLRFVPRRLAAQLTEYIYRPPS